MKIRRYNKSDCKILAELFYNTVHTVNARDYSQEQLDVWATENINLEKWHQSFIEHYSLVAIADGIIVGFGDIDMNGYLDRLFVHVEYQKMGIATELCNQLEKFVEGSIITHASITAKNFFANRGYKVIKEQQVERDGVYLKNFIMIKKK